ncbi:hypothetical protein [Hymenobacter sp. HDW8]|uniref:hypothetical protein n=1 Tax=Hymenobacter sp. HDW8 TaxID=2714932 RepID=UPI0014081E6C|nr:hypothetical protein [Hymenobacter sp. HDW8]QIL76850.1 hypothetical protein G7064_14025 [Hymenobacter sp. HDW8]
MKSLLKFLLLFSLIIVGKLAKEPVAGDIAAKRVAPNELSVHMVSFFSRQATLQGTTSGDGKQWWLQEQAQLSNN